MTVTHIVMFRFKDEITTTQKQDLNAEMLGLKEACIHPDTNKPYIVSSRGGAENSIEGMADGFMYAFVVEFASVEDRNYYAEKDPAHLKFKSKALGFLEKAQIVDFTGGIF